MKRLGVISALYRYPIKSMAGESLPSATLGWQGVEGDRRFAFRRLTDASDFPWLTAGKVPSLVRYRPVLAAGQPLRVVTPSGVELEGHSEALRQELSAAWGSGVELMQWKHGLYDEAPLSLITTATIRHVCESSGVPMDARRFRPNLVIDVADEAPFGEDVWVGQTLRLGDALLSVTQRDLRCSMVNLDPDTAQSEPQVLRTTARVNGAYAGVYAVPLRTGLLRVGDELFAPESARD